MGIKSIISRYFNMGTTPHWIILAIDSVLVVLATLLACFLNYGTSIVILQQSSLALTLGVCVSSFWIGFYLMHTYQGILRYSSFIDLYRIGIANFIGIMIALILQHIVGIDGGNMAFMRHVLFATFFIATSGMWLLRITVKYIYDIYFVSATAKKVFIYGVKEGGIALAKSIHSQESNFVVAGFVSDNKDDLNHIMMGARIYFNDDRLVENMKRMKAKALMVSPLKTESFRNNQPMIDALTKAGIKIMLYSRQEWDGKSDIRHTQLKEVDIEDLLPRNQIEVDLESIAKVLSGKCILITGAAGSIGSEMVKQVASFLPRQMVLIDQAETPLHDIRLMMAKDFPDIPTLTLTASICHQWHMEGIFKQYRPDYVFHAAAYKHVPMMEDNPSEAVANNIEGTRIMADLAVKYGVRKFVMISTDKAVNPTNVMGCSKRICEMYCQSLNKAIQDGKVEGATQFVTTRFGNVLGSNGSVIPLFKEQIKMGGPLTVTHPDIIRYFMLIPEACKLVLQAGTMGHGGEIFVFDMGKPVKIADLARRMILLSEAPHVQIKYTGLRDGEKLYEELLSKEENTVPSSHPKIKLAKLRELGYDEVKQGIDELIAIAISNDDAMCIVQKMKLLVPEFKSKHSKYEVLDKK